MGEHCVYACECGVGGADEAVLQLTVCGSINWG